MTIRRAETGDTEGLIRLLYQVCRVHHDGRPDLFKKDAKKYTDEELAEILKDENRPIFVAVNEDNWVMGYMFCVVEDYTGDTMRTDIKTLYIDDLCVDETVRGTHVGASLYQYVLDYAKKSGFYNVTLNVWSCNPNAMGFYQHMGLVPYKVGMEKIL